MEWSGCGVVLIICKYGENDVVLEVMIEECGCYFGFVCGGWFKCYWLML